MMVRNAYEDMSSEEAFYRVQATDYWATTSHYSRVLFDPILTPLFAGLFANLGVTGSFFGMGLANTLGSLATAIVTTAVTTGIQMLLAPKPPKPEDGKAPLTQGIPPCIWGVGTTRMAGAFMLWEAIGPKLYGVQAFTAHRISKYNRFWLHDDEVTTAPDGSVNPVNGRYSGKVKIFSRIGEVPETPYAELVADLAAEGIWTNSHRGDGQASLAMICTTPKAKYYTDRFPYGIPRLTAEADLAEVWDFRDPAQDPEDPSKWTFSKNPVLQLCWHWCFNEFGHLKDYRKAILPVLDMWKEEADICDEFVPLAGGGTERRYTCSGWDTTERQPKVGTNAIMAACDGWMCQRGDGALLITVGKFRESRVVTLTDADILGHSIAYDTLPEEEINRIVPKINYPDTDYSTTDTDFFEDQAAQLIAGRVLAEDMNLQWVTSWTLGRRLGWREWQRILQKVRGSLNVGLPGINAVYSRWIRLETPRRLPKLDGALVENRRGVIDLMKGGFKLDVVKHPENIDHWTTAMEGQKPPVPPKPNPAGIPTAVILSVTPKSSSRTVYLSANLDDPLDESLTATIRYRVSDVGGGVPGAWVEKVNAEAEAVAGVVVVATDVVPSDMQLDVQAAFITAKGKYGNWSATHTVFTTADPVAPSALTTFIVSDAAPHLGTVRLSFSTDNDSRVRKVDLYRVATGVPLDPNTATLMGTQAVGPSATYTPPAFGDTTRTNIISNGDFPTNLTGWTAGSGWAWSAGAAKKTAGTPSDLTQTVSMVAGDVMRIAVDMSSRTAGQMTISLTGTSNVNSTGKTVNGPYLERLTANASSVGFRLRGDATFDGAGDNVIVFKETVTCIQQGVWDFYAVPRNGSNVPGPTSGPITVTIA